MKSVILLGWFVGVVGLRAESAVGQVSDPPPGGVESVEGGSNTRPTDSVGASALPPLVVTATRTPAEPQTLGSAVDAITPADLARCQITTFSGALGEVAGAPLFASGATGAGASLFLRGANSNQTLFLVDGIRLDDPNTDYNIFLGG